MSVKTEVLRLLTEARGNALSGEALADQLQVSRNAVWKAINKLKEEGYDIEGVTHRGYSLKADAEAISQAGILSYIKEAWRDRPVVVLDVVDSTNNYAKILAASGTAHGTLVTANEQTSGRGRRGHSFYSPANTGVYMTICFTVDTDFAGGVLYTTAAAVAVARAIEKVNPTVHAEIKWVNDIYIDEKKVCGILSEAVTDIESGRINHVVVGIGINVTTEHFPEDVEDRAASIAGRGSGAIRNRLIAEVYNEMMDWARNPEDQSFMNEYRDRSLLIGREIVYTAADQTGLRGIARNITDAGELVIETEDGRMICVNSGECSAKPAR